MALATEFECNKCFQKLHGTAKNTKIGVMCFPCFEKYEEDEKEAFLVERRTNHTTEERLRYIEEWIYNMNKELPEIRMTVSLNRNWLSQRSLWK